MVYGRLFVFCAVGAWLLCSGALSAETLLESRSVSSEEGLLQVRVTEIAGSETKHTGLREISLQDRVEARLEFTDRHGTRIVVDSVFTEELFTATYQLPKGEFSLTSPFGGNVSKLKITSSESTRLLYEGSVDSFCSDADPDVREAMSTVVTPSVKAAFESLQRAIEKQRLVPEELSEFYDDGTSRNLSGWACGVLLGATDLSGFGAAIACVGCSPAAGGTGCLPCLGWVVSTLGMGGGALAACADYMGGAGDGTGGGNDPSQEQCWELDDGTVLCVDSDGHVVEISP